MPLLSNKAYDVLKWFVTIGLPAFGAFYFTVSQIWNFPASEQVTGTITAIIVFLGVLLRQSTKKYNETEEALDTQPMGDLIVSTVDGERYLSLGVNRDSLDDLISKDVVRLNVVDKGTFGR